MLLLILIASLSFKQVPDYKEGIIHVTMDVISKQGTMPYLPGADFKFSGEMLIEPLTRIDVTEVAGRQTSVNKPDGYMIIDTKSKKYYRVDSLTCDANPSKWRIEDQIRRHVI